MNLDELVKKAAAQIAANRERKQMKVEIKTLGKTFTFQSMTAQEAADVLKRSGDDDWLFMKKYIYESCEELRAIALPLAEEGKIAEYSDVVELLPEKDMMALFTALVELRGERTDSVIEIKDLKN